MTQIDDYLDGLVNNGKTPSVQYIIFNHDSIIHHYRDGFADVLNRKKVDETTTYSAFSVTKTFTALAVLQLAENGELDIDESAAKYIVDFPYPHDIAVRQLLSHTSGISNPNPLPWIHRAEDHSTFDSDMFFDQVFTKHKKIKSPPNKKFAYSNLGYILLGQLIEQVSRQKYENYIREHILIPLGLSQNELDFEIFDPTLKAKGYHKKMSLLNWILGIYIDKETYRGKSEGKWQPFKNMYINGTSYGGLIGNPNAFMTYLKELLKDDCKLISPEYKQMLFSENITNDNKPTGVCLSWFTGELNGERYVAHAGGGGGYYVEIRMYPESGIGSIVMFNRSGMSDERFLDKLDKFYIGKTGS
jgi:D-alanyl-D-alanine carboxypeptidase